MGWQIRRTPETPFDPPSSNRWAKLRMTTRLILLNQGIPQALVLQSIILDNFHFMRRNEPWQLKWLTWHREHGAFVPPVWDHVEIKSGRQAIRKLHIPGHFSASVCRNITTPVCTHVHEKYQPALKREADGSSLRFGRQKRFCHGDTRHKDLITRIVLPMLSFLLLIPVGCIICLSAYAHTAHCHLLFRLS